MHSEVQCFDIIDSIGLINHMPIQDDFSSKNLNSLVVKTMKKTFKNEAA